MIRTLHLWLLGSVQQHYGKTFKGSCFPTMTLYTFKKIVQVYCVVVAWPTSQSCGPANLEELKSVSDYECHFWSWLLYIAFYLSMILMLIIVVIFQPQLISPKFNAVILAAQLMVLPSNLHMLRVKSAGIGTPLFVYNFNLIYYLYNNYFGTRIPHPVVYLTLLLSPKHPAYTCNGLLACHLHTDISTRTVCCH